MGSTSVYDSLILSPKYLIFQLIYWYNTNWALSFETTYDHILQNEDSYSLSVCIPIPLFKFSAKLCQSFCLRIEEILRPQQLDDGPKKLRSNLFPLFWFTDPSFWVKQPNYLLSVSSRASCYILEDTNIILSIENNLESLSLTFCHFGIWGWYR